MAVCRSKRETLRRTPPSSTRFSTLRDMPADSAEEDRICASFRRFRGNFQGEFDQTFHFDVWNERTNTTENRIEQQRKIMRESSSGWEKQRLSKWQPQPHSFIHCSQPRSAEDVLASSCGAFQCSPSIPIWDPPVLPKEGISLPISISVGLPIVTEMCFIWSAINSFKVLRKIRSLNIEMDNQINWMY